LPRLRQAAITPSFTPYPGCSASLKDAIVASITQATAPTEDRLDILVRDHAGKRFLLVEDDRFNQYVAEELLSVTGLDLEMADDGVHAVDMARQAADDLILMDMQMPKMCGVEAARHIRQNCEAAGMDKFFTKPSDPMFLYVVLLKWLAAPPRGEQEPRLNLVTNTSREHGLGKTQPLPPQAMDQGQRHLALGAELPPRGSTHPDNGSHRRTTPRENIAHSQPARQPDPAPRRRRRRPGCCRSCPFARSTGVQHRRTACADGTGRGHANIDVRIRDRTGAALEASKVGEEV
jgi:hypothetical protein